MKYVIYMGVVFMPDGNAAAQRALAFGKLVKHAGYSPVVLGMCNQAVDNVLSTKMRYEDIEVFSMPYPKSISGWMRMITSISDIRCVIENLGKENIKAIIAMDYFSFALARLMGYCKKNNIDLIVDTVDWFVKSQYKFPKNIIKNLDTKIRMEVLNFHAQKMITISSFLYEYYKKKVGQIVNIPGMIVSKKLNEQNNAYKGNNYLTLAFVGNPGNYCEKEKIDWLIEIVCKINSENQRIVFHIAGISEEVLRAHRPELFGFNNIDSSVVFHGKITHDECIELISKCDFSVIIREDTLLSRAGFPTKLGESFACGTPVFVTPTSNIVDYISNTHGIVTDECTYASVEKTLYELLEMSAMKKEEMHKQVGLNNPLEYVNFTDEFMKIMRNE